jgi:hypothetical protein
VEEQIVQEQSAPKETAKPLAHKEQQLRVAAERFKDGKLIKDQLRKLQRAR